jgi:hypothetical protein
MLRPHNFLVIFLSFLLLLPGLAFGYGSKGGGNVSVRAYYRSNGTYVQPHMRSAPDGNFSNNWSTVGNVNPYTGTPGTKTRSFDEYSGTAPPETPHQNSPSISTSDDENAYDTRGTTAVGSSSIPKRPYKSNFDMPRHSKLNYLGNGWECQRGYRQAGQECVVVEVPQNGKLDYLGNRWECQRSYRQVGQGCVAVEVPKNGKLDYLGHGWECQRSYRQVGQECVAVDVPKNGKLDYLGHGWECQRGYRQAGQECLAVDVPKNGRLDYLGHGWECQRGYRQAGEGCAVVDVPKNGKLDYLGHGWECQRGYHQAGEECITVQISETGKADYLADASVNASSGVEA